LAVPGLDDGVPDASVQTRDTRSSRDLSPGIGVLSQITYCDSCMEAYDSVFSGGQVAGEEE